MINKDLTIFVSTCDSYSDLWIPFSKCLEKYVNVGCEVIFVSESKKFDRYHTITPGFLPWGERNLIALSEVKTKYVFWLFEDYFFNKKITKSDMQKYLDFANKKDIDRIQISPNFHNKDKLFFLKEYEFTPKFKFEKVSHMINYSISMQPSIWKKEYVISILNKNYSPWEFEIKGSLMNKSDKVYIDSSIKQHPYFNAVRKKTIYNLSYIINKIDKVLEKTLLSKKPYKYSKGYKAFLKNENIEN